MSEGTKPYPKYILALNTDEGFDKFFDSMICEYRTLELAYEATERHIKEYFGKRRYKNYESYRVSRINRT